MSTAYRLVQRRIIALAGADRVSFLQGLVSNDVTRIAERGAIYAALLSPQGKISYDFLVASTGDSLLIDCAADSAQALMRKLLMYRLRAQVEITARDDWGVAVLMDAAAPGGGISFVDPRHDGLGIRWLAPVKTLDDALGAGALDDAAYAARRIALGVPEGTADFGAESTLALEGNLDLLHGVDFDKGCYVGQELTARTHHRGKVRYRIFTVDIDGAAAPGTEVTQDGRAVGKLLSIADGKGLARLRREDVAAGSLVAGSARLGVEPLSGEEGA